MYKLLFIIIIFFPFSYSFSNDSYKEDISYISMTFSKNSLVEDFDLLYIIDTTEQNQLNFHIKRSGIDADLIIKEILIDKTQYSHFLSELSNIDSITDSINYIKSFIAISIIEKDSIKKRYLFYSPSQINKYLEVSDRILGSRNFMPFRDYMGKLK